MEIGKLFRVEGIGFAPGKNREQQNLLLGKEEDQFFHGFVCYTMPDDQGITNEGTSNNMDTGNQQSRKRAKKIYLRIISYDKTGHKCFTAMIPPAASTALKHVRHLELIVTVGKQNSTPVPLKLKAATGQQPQAGGAPPKKLARRGGFPMRR